MGRERQATDTQVLPTSLLQAPSTAQQGRELLRGRPAVVGGTSMQGAS